MSDIEDNEGDTGETVIVPFEKEKHTRKIKYKKSTEKDRRGHPSKAFVDEETGKIILEDERAELYCHYRAQGFGKSQSYRMCGLGDNAKPNSINVMAQEFEKRPYIAERLIQVREERASVASVSQNREEALSRWNDMFSLGQMISGKEGLKMMVEAQKNIDKICGFAEGEGRPLKEGDAPTFVSKEEFQDEAIRLANIARSTPNATSKPAKKEEPPPVIN